MRDGKIDEMKILPILQLRQFQVISIILLGNSFNSFSLFDRRMSLIPTHMIAA